MLLRRQPGAVAPARNVIGGMPGRKSVVIGEGRRIDMRADFVLGQRPFPERDVLVRRPERIWLVSSTK